MIIAVVVALVAFWPTLTGGGGGGGGLHSWWSRPVGPNLLICWPTTALGHVLFSPFKPGWAPVGSRGTLG